jgi:hypothetical protein
MKERGDVEDLGVDGRIQLICTLKKLCGRAWTGFLWLRIGAIGALL